MGNITISMDETALSASRKYAKEHNISLNGLIRKLLGQTVIRSSSGWLDESFQMMDRAGGDSRGREWTREGLYDR